MHLTARFTLTPSEALRGNRAFRWRWYLGSVAFGAGLAIAGAAGALLAPGDRQPAVFLALAGLLFAVLPEILLRRALARRGPLAQAAVEATLTEAGLSLRSGGAEGQLAWEALRKTARRGGFWIFQITASQAVLVPERALDAKANADLAAFLRARAGADR